MPSKPRRPARTTAGSQVPTGEKPKRAAADWLGTAEDDPFDLWLRQSLHEAFDAIAAEPVPEDVLRLIEEDRAERERLRRRRRADKPDTDG